MNRTPRVGALAAFVTEPNAVPRVTAVGCAAGCLVSLVLTPIFTGFLYTTSMYAFGDDLGLVFGILTVPLVITALLFYRSRLLAEKAKSEAEAQRLLEEQSTRAAVARAAAQQAELVEQLRGFASRATHLADNLPKYVTLAERSLDEAENEFKEGNFPRFWSEIEKTVNALAGYDEDIRQILYLRMQHQQRLPQLGGSSPEFHLAIGALADAKRTYERMDLIVRRAQKQPDFAKIYEMRQHNRLLAQGFSSLGDALANLGSTIEASVSDLRSSIVDRLSDLNYEQQHASTALVEGQHLSLEEERKQRELLERIARETKG